MSNLFKLLFDDDESVVSSICEDPAEQRKYRAMMSWQILIPAIQSKEVRMTTYQSKVVNVLLKSDQKRKTSCYNTIYEDQHINDDEMPIASSKFQRFSSRVRKTIDTLILSATEIKSWCSNGSFRWAWGLFRLEKSPLVDEREKLSNLQSVMNALAYIMQCTTHCEHRSIEWPFRKVI